MWLVPIPGHDLPEGRRALYKSFGGLIRCTIRHCRKYLLAGDSGIAPL